MQFLGLGWEQVGGADDGCFLLLLFVLYRVQNINADDSGITKEVRGAEGRGGREER